ncbi:hypothetical protein [Marinactinospora rubrisoli]|uniref:DUF2567 domain-containing protein n=1 Tax=Marinactinospora rubrisoli TaxID=2715399 RepID=A0ABW2KGM8_9ACTN
MRRHFVVGGTALGIVTALGLPLGLLWWAVAPRAEMTVSRDGEPLPYPLSEALFAAEGHFAIMMAATGLACGYAGYLAQYRWSARHRVDLRLAMLLGVTAGTALAGVVAWRTGVLLDAPTAREALAQAAPGDIVPAALDVRSVSALLMGPFVAVLQYGLFDAISMWRRDLPFLPDEEAREPQAEQEIRADPADGAEPSPARPPVLRSEDGATG